MFLALKVSVLLGERAFFLGTTENDKNSNDYHLDNVVLVSFGSCIEPIYLADADGRRVGFLKHKGKLEIQSGDLRVRTLRMGTFLTLFL